MLVIACKRQIPAIASRVPATRPGFPTAITLDADALPYRRKSIGKTVIDSDIRRRKFVSSAPAEPIFLIISPVKLIKIDPQSINMIALVRRLENEKYIGSG